MINSIPKRFFSSIIFVFVLTFFVPVAFSNQKNFEFPNNIVWFNADKPISVSALKGRFILVHFWGTSGIDIQSVVDQIHALQKKYPTELLVVSVHSAKTLDDDEMNKNIVAAMDRYGMDYPVAVDNQLTVLKAFRLNSWPSAVLIGPDGKVLFSKSGETDIFYFFDGIIRKNIPRFEKVLSKDPMKLLSAQPQAIRAKAQSDTTLSQKVVKNKLLCPYLIDHIGTISQEDRSIINTSIKNIENENSSTENVTGEDSYPKSFIFDFAHFTGEKVSLNREYSRNVGKIKLKLRLPDRAHLLGSKSYVKVFTKEHGLWSKINITNLNSEISLDRELIADRLYLDVMLYYCREGKSAVCLLKGILFDVPLTDYSKKEDIVIEHEIAGESL